MVMLSRWAAATVEPAPTGDWAAVAVPAGTASRTAARRAVNENLPGRTLRLRMAFLPMRGWGSEERVRTLTMSIRRCPEQVNTLQCEVTSRCERHGVRV